MNSFQYIAAKTPEEAVNQIGKNGRYLAGGVDLLGELKEYIVSPDILVALKMTPGPDQIRPAPPTQTNGAAPAEVWIDFDVTMAELARHAEIGAKFPALAQAAGEVGSPQIRNVATLGGNLLQHSRCWYYRQPDVTCLKRGGSTCYAPEGENKYLALFSGCACVSPVVSNTAVALTALGAGVHLRRAPSGFAEMPVENLYAAAWKNPLAHHALRQGDFLVGVTVPTQRDRSAYRQISEKREFDWALVSCAAAANVRDGIITNARIALGAIAPGPHMSEEANAFLEGKDLNEETIAQATDLLLQGAKPLSQNGYKVPLARTLIRRTLLALNA